MLSNELITFCNRWLKKADKYSDDITAEVFDKFFSLYVLYNVIYTEATIKLKEKNSKFSNKDRKTATENIQKYIGQNILFAKLQDLSHEIDQIVNLLKNGTFYISTKRDNITPDIAKDNEYITNIENNRTAQNITNKTKFNEAIPSLIYGVRYNMFHGEKGFDPIQKELLSPINNILEAIINDLILNSNNGGK